MATLDFENVLNVVNNQYDDLENAMKILQDMIASELFGWTTPYGSGGDSLLEVLRRGHSNKKDRATQD
jgi:nitrogen fixation-related uncharacterized protein